MKFGNRSCTRSTLISMNLRGPRIPVNLRRAPVTLAAANHARGPPSNGLEAEVLDQAGCETGERDAKEVFKSFTIVESI